MSDPQKVAAASVDSQPSDNELVMGVVTSGDPLTVLTRGEDVKPGRLASAGLSEGDNVAMLREGGTWLALGRLIAGDGVGGLGLRYLDSAEATLNLGLTASDQPVAGLSLSFSTLNPNAMMFAFWTAEYITLAANTSTSNAQLYLDGVAQSNQSATLRIDAANQRICASTANLLSVTTPGDHTVVVQARTSGGAGLVNVNSSNSFLIVAVFE